jgi:NDP-sugar pyrophosphorylase family protein
MTSLVPKIAVIMAGGEGTRLRPLTYEIPKPLVPIHGKPLVEYIIEKLSDDGVEEIVLSIGHDAEKIKAHFSKAYKNKRLTYVVESKPLGTGGGLAFAYSKIKDRVEDNFLSTNGDTLTKYDLKAMYRLHKKRKALVTILVREEEEVSTLGVAELEGDMVKRFIEKPPPGTTTSKMVNIGTFLISKEAMSMMPGRDVFSFERDFLAKAVDTKRIHAYVTKGQYYTVDDFAKYEKAILNWK